MANREQFHTFDALRFFSFVLVFLSHFPFAITHFKFRGDIGVYFFFTLSGFLITFILLSQKKESGGFHFKNYMLRRALRIWPLYYLALLFAFLTPLLLSGFGLEHSDTGYKPNWLMSILFFENYMVIYHGSFANVSPLPVLWSLCIEEHFYIVWGLVLYCCNEKRVPYCIVAFILLANVCRVVYNFEDWGFFDLFTNFDYFMYGAIPAYLYVNHKENTIRKINALPHIFKWLVLIATIVYVLSSPYLYFYGKRLIEPVIFGSLFASILLIVLPKQNFFKIGGQNIFSRLGIYTYGLYIVHTIFINLMLRIAGKLQTGEAMAHSAFVMASSLLLTVCASIGCYYLIEKPFLKLKPKY